MLRRIAVGIAVVGLAAIQTCLPSAAEARATTPTWAVNDYVASDASAYLAISRQGPHNAWAVGTNVVRRWDGVRWVSVPMPTSAGHSLVELDEVAAVSASEAWVAGSVDVARGYAAAVVAHRFHGRWYTHRFTRHFLVNQISVIAPGNVWLLGADYTTSDWIGVSWHWNGRTWSRGTLPFVTAKSSDDAHWAGGVTGRGTASRLLHYVGGRWIVDTSLHVTLRRGQTGYYVGDVIQRSPDDVYAAVGFAARTSAPRQHVELYHWDGRSWTLTISLPGNTPTYLTNDGYGGVWLLSHGKHIHARIRDIRSARVVATLAPPKYKPGPLFITDLTLRPGTRTLWAVGDTADLGNVHTHAVIAAHRP